MEEALKSTDDFLNEFALDIVALLLGVSI